MDIDYIIDWLYTTASQYGNETVTLGGGKRPIRTVCLDAVEVLQKCQLVEKITNGRTQLNADFNEYGLR